MVKVVLAYLLHSGTPVSKKKKKSVVQSLYLSTLGEAKMPGSPDTPAASRGNLTMQLTTLLCPPLFLLSGFLLFRSLPLFWEENKLLRL